MGAWDLMVDMTLIGKPPSWQPTSGSPRRGKVGRDALLKWFITRRVRKMLNLLKFEWLQGHRTQVAAVLIALLTLALNLGWIDQKAYSSIVAFLTGIGLLTASVHRPTP